MYDFPLNVAAGGVQEMRVQGAYFCYAQCTAGADDPEIRIKGRGVEVSLLPGQWFRLPANVGDLRVHNDGALDIAGVVKFAGPDHHFGDSRIAGEVLTLDGARRRSMDNQAFIASLSYQASVGEYCYLQLWNPAGSGKRLLLKTVRATQTGASQNVSYLATAALSVLSSNVPVSMLSKTSGNAASVAQCRALSSASIANSQNYLHQFHLNTYEHFFDEFPCPLVLKPGTGFVLTNFSTAHMCKATWHFGEESDS